MSDATRSVKLGFENRTSHTLYCAMSVTGGAILQASAAHIAPGASMTLSGSSGSETCSGSVAFHKDSADGSECYAFDYDTSAKTDAKKLTYKTAKGCAVGPQSIANSANAVDATLTLYPGIPQAKDSKLMVMSLGDDPMTLARTVPHVFADFTNAMFDPDLRSVDAVTALVTAATGTITNKWDANDAPPVFYADFTGGQLPAIVAMWKEYWLNGTTGACPAADAVLIDRLKGFVATSKATNIWLPRLTVHDAGPPAVFNLKGYNRIGFYKGGTPAGHAPEWSASTVERFLTLLASGGHVVQICASADLPGTRYSSASDFYATFASAAIVRGDEIGSSHYVAPGALRTNAEGWYFLDIDGENMPAQVVAKPGAAAVDAGLLNAFMTSMTVTGVGVDGGDYNAFFQLEGWQQQGLGGGARHMYDYDTYNKIAWNISTFGASPYSEKRATSVFLAPDGWTPAVTQVTCMMPYVGAYATQRITSHGGWAQAGPILPQTWLRTELVRIDGGNPIQQNQIIETVTA